jgi:TolB protein
MRTLRIFPWFVLSMISVLSSCNKSNPVPPMGDWPVYPQIDAYPAWSPDGQTVIYNHGGITNINREGAYQINTDSSGFWLINSDGSNPHLIMKGNQENACWSPDGRWAAFEMSAQIYKAPISENGVDTSGIVQLTSAGRNFFPAWSPDGQWIAYSQSICQGDNTCGIWLIKSDDTGQLFLSPYGNYPSWYPKGMVVLYITRAITSTGQVMGDSLWSFDVQANSRRFLLLLQGKNYDNRYVRYSPEGTKITFTSQPNGGTNQIWVMNSDGTNLRQLTTNGGDQPSWSADGKKIAFVSYDYTKYDPENNGTLWVMNSDGSVKHQLTHGPAQN